MSERSSFTTEYIYNYETYKILREELEKKQFLYDFMVAPQHGTMYPLGLPILSGKISVLSQGCEFLYLDELLSGIKTPTDVRFVIMCENEDIILMKKFASGEIETYGLIPTNPFPTGIYEMDEYRQSCKRGEEA